MPGSIPNNTRASRSRFSSPQLVQHGTATDPPKINGAGATQKGIGAGWQEPPVDQKASFHQAGMMRHGVFERMEPLGTLPKKTSVPEQTPARKIPRIVLKKSGASHQNTPAAVAPADEDDEEDYIAEEQMEQEAPRAAQVPARRSLAALRDTDDGDYDPKSASVSAHNAARVKVTRSSMGRSTPQQQRTPGPQQDTPETSQARSLGDDKELMDRVVEAAVDEALRHSRYPTAWALRTLYDENYSNARFMTLLEDIFSQTADPEQVQEYVGLIREKKKLGKKDNTGCEFFTGLPGKDRPPPNPKPAPYASLVKLFVPTQHTVDPVDPVNPAAPVPRIVDSVHPDAHVSKKHKSNRHQHQHRSPFAKMAVDANGFANASSSTPSRRHRRGESHDSSSTLSSALSLSPPRVNVEDVDDADDDGSVGVPAEARSTNTAAGTATGAERSGSGSTAAAATKQPIATRRRAVAAKKNGVLSPTRNSQSQVSSPGHNKATVDNPALAGMLFAVGDDAIFPNLAAKKAVAHSHKSRDSSPHPFSIKFDSRVGVLSEDDKTRRRREARNVTNTAVPDSFIRGGDSLRSGFVDDDEFDDLPPPPPPANVLQRRARAATLRNTRSTRKRSHDEVDDEASPTTFTFPPPEPPNSAFHSRPGTPAGPRAKKPRTGLRVKNSPMKKKDGPSAGVPRASGERASPVPNGAPNSQDDNDDYCSSCGGNGELVCCDGCTRSFHFKCVDPPLQENVLPDEWFCNVCLTTRHPADMLQYAGLFGSLLIALDKKNSSAFRLGDDIRNYFEGVKTGADGEYEDVVVMPPKSKKKGGAEEGPDFFKIRDAEGNAILCHSCSGAAGSSRAIIPCSACPYYWHLDCLDPPMANPPVLRHWKCPAHVEDLQNKLAGPSHKWRRIKSAPAIKPAFGRGMVNNGFIEIDDDDESDDETGWNDFKSFGRVYRLPAIGIKLDFVNQFSKRVQSVDREEEGNTTTSAPTTSPLASNIPAAPSGYLLDRSTIDLAQATQNTSVLDKSLDLSGELIHALLAEAPPAALSLMAMGNAQNIEQGTNLVAGDIVALGAMKSRIEYLLAEAKAATQAGPVEAAAAASTNEQTEASPELPSIAETDVTPSKAFSPADLPSSPTPAKIITASEDDEDTEADDAPIATPVAPLSDDPNAPEVAVAAADVPPGETEVPSAPKTAPVIETPVLETPVVEDKTPQGVLSTHSPAPVLRHTEADDDEEKAWGMDLD